MRTCAARRTSAASRSQRRAPTGSRSTGPATSRPSRRSSARAPSPTTIWPSSFPTSTGRRSSRPGSCTGRYPAILKDNKVGVEAQKLFDDAQALLKRMVAEKWVKASGVVGFWPANSSATTSSSSPTTTRKEPLAMLHTLRQQMARDPSRDRAHTALADFVAPTETRACRLRRRLRRHRRPRRGRGDRVAHIAATDDYSRIIAEGACRPPRRGLRRAPARARAQGALGLCAAERTLKRGLILEKYRGIRPAPGYPAQPDHTEKATLWKLMDVRGRDRASSSPRATPCGPGASVSGLYLSHPDSHYFGVGKVERDQVEDYARRKGWTIERGRALARAGVELRSALAARRRRLSAPAMPIDENAEGADIIRAFFVLSGSACYAVPRRGDEPGTRRNCLSCRAYALRRCRTRWQR